MAGTAAEDFSPRNRAEVTAEALASLARVLNRSIPRPEAAYFHDWRRDPYFRGAYSYVPVEALPARRTLGKPVEDTLLFAGEATEQQGASATVHGAIATGHRAADLILERRVHRRKA